MPLIETSFIGYGNDTECLAKIYPQDLRIDRNITFQQRWPYLATFANFPDPLCGGCLLSRTEDIKIDKMGQ